LVLEVDAVYIGSEYTRRTWCWRLVLDRLFRRKTRFLVRLSKRGNSSVVGFVEAANQSEAFAKVIELIQKREDAGNWPTIRLLNVETGVEVKLPNPLAAQEEEESFESSRGRGRGRSLVEELADEMIQQNLIGAFTFLSTLMANTMKSLGDGFGQAIAAIVRNMAQPQQPPPPIIQQQPEGSRLRDIVDAANVMIQLYRLWREDREAFEEFFQKRLSNFLGYTSQPVVEEEVGGGGGGGGSRKA
jgi:hypothetical protein